MIVIKIVAKKIISPNNLIKLNLINLALWDINRKNNKLIKMTKNNNQNQILYLGGVCKENSNYKNLWINHVKKML